MKQIEQFGGRAISPRLVNRSPDCTISRGFMIYTIKYFQDSRPTGAEHWTGIFGEAKALAEHAVKTGAAQKVEIFGEDGQLVFHYPPTSQSCPEPN